MSNQSSGKVHQFGRFRYDPTQRLLYREDELLALQPKTIETLHTLLEHRGQIVEKAELMRLVWPDCVVEEIGLARNISLLRKALGDEAGTYVETIPKRGYRFTAPIDVPSIEVPGPEPKPRRPDWTVLWLTLGLLALGGLIYWQFYLPSRYLPPSRGMASLAVIPFECLSPDLERDAYCRRLSDAIVVEISKLDSVQLTSPSTVHRYQRLRIPVGFMARALWLQVVLEGTVEIVGNQTRTSVRLTDVHSGKLVWAESYDTPWMHAAAVEPAVVQ